MERAATSIRPVVLIGLVLLLSGARRAGAQSKAGPTAAAVSVETTNQHNQDTLYVAVIKALQSITEQEESAAIQTSVENKSLLTPDGVQKGLLVVGILYSGFAALQWLAIRRQANIAQRTLELVERPYLSCRINRVFWQEEGIEHVRLRVNYSLVNSGRTPARITDHNSVLCRTSSKEKPQEVRYDPNAQHRVKRLSILAGREYEATPIWLTLTASEKRIVTHGIENTEAFVHFFTYVHYNDGLGKGHSAYLGGLVVTGRHQERDLYPTFLPDHQCKEDT